MKKIIIVAILLFFTPLWLALLFIFGQNSAAIIFNSKEKNILSVENLNLPKLYLVQSGSMEPAVGVGSIVLVSHNDNYVNGDIVSFDLQGNGKNIVTHRISYKEFPNGINGDPAYITKGDANEDFDSVKISNKQIIGKVNLTIPYLGYLASAAKKPWGFILLVIVPATILIYEELKTIFSEAKKGAKKALGKVRKSPYDSISLEFPKSESVYKRNFLTRLFKSWVYLVPIFGSFLVFISFSSSFFSDNEPSTGNLFQAGVWSPLAAETLVIHEVMPNSNCGIGGDKSPAWIEIWNGFDVAVDLKNYHLNDGSVTVDIVNAVTIVQPDTFVLIAKDNSVWTQCYTPANGILTINLGNNSPINLGTGIIKIIDTDGTTVLDHVVFPSDLQPDTSFERVALGQDSETGDGWIPDGPSDFSVQCPSSPGFWVSPTGSCPVVINEIMWAGGHLSGANGTNDEWIELRNITSSAIDLSGWKIEGAISGSGSFNITTGSIPANGLFLISNFDKATSRINIDPDIVDTTLQLDNTNAQYFLRNNLGNIVDTADDNSGNPPAGSSTAPKKSMERLSTPGNGALPGNWTTALTHTNMDGSGSTDEYATPKSANGI